MREVLYFAIKLIVVNAYVSEIILHFLKPEKSDIVFVKSM